MMRWERAWDKPLTAFPAFHATWAALAAVVFARRWRRAEWAWWLMAIAIGASCVTTGMHAAADVLAGFVVAWLVARAERLWEAVRAWAERVANSWRETTIGPVRLLSHSTWAAAGAWCGLALALVTAGPEALVPVMTITVGSIVGAALWAQMVEGSPQLLRPYGYYGSALFAVLGFVVAALVGYDGWLLAAAFAVGGSVTQALGRGRCLVQGCCHGKACAAWLGIRFTHPRSRVTRLSTLGGTPVHRRRSTRWAGCFSWRRLCSGCGRCTRRCRSSRARISRSSASAGSSRSTSEASRRRPCSWASVSTSGSRSRSSPAG